MTAYNGILNDDIGQGLAQGWSASFDSATAGPPEQGFDIPQIESVIPTEIGSHSLVLPTEIEESRNGEKVPSFLDDYYYRFHLEHLLDFGYILSEVEDTFTVWNAYFESKTVTALTRTNSDEYSLSGLTTPFILEALEETTYTATAYADGAAEFSSLVTFDFGIDDSYTWIIITGSRLVLFKWTPLQPIQEDLEWLTEILRAKDGTEQRISVRRIPRQSFRFSIYLETHQQQAIFEALLHTWQKKAWGLPIWAEWESHSGTINALDTTITVDTTNADFRDDGMAVIYKSETEYEIIKIDTVSAGSLSLSTAVQNTFTGDKIIMPLRIAQMSTSVKRTDAADGYAFIDFQFIVKDNVLLTDYSAPTSYNSLPVLTQATLEKGGLQKVSDADIKSIDFSVGDFLIYSDSDFNMYTQGHVFENYTKADAWQHRLFLHYLIGQLNTVWIPSFKDDMIATEVIGSSDTTFKITNIGLTDNMGLNDLRTHLAFILPDNSMILREIMGISEVDASEELIEIDTSLGQEIAIGGATICFLDKYRLSSDKLSIEWKNKGWNSNKLNWLRVKE
ncbi:MAG TPA: hypothetical protein VMV86_06780 [Methanosarcinales archaeon]|nr:hypothetical protein [Methanosarcinales archaeon]